MNNVTRSDSQEFYVIPVGESPPFKRVKLMEKITNPRLRPPTPFVRGKEDSPKAFKIIDSEDKKEYLQIHEFLKVLDSID